MDILEFNRLFNLYQARMVRFAYGYVKDTAIAEDFVMEAFSTFWQRRKELTVKTKPQAYVLTIVKNKCLNHLQHLQVRQRMEQNMSQNLQWSLNTRISTLEACDPTLLFSKEVQQILDETLKRLPDRTREIFVLSRSKGYSYKEIAEELHISVKTVEFHISKALERLRVALRDFVYLLPFLMFLL